MDSQHGHGRDLVLAGMITLFVAGALFGAGLARLAAGEVATATFYCVLGAALSWAASQSGRGAGA